MSWQVVTMLCYQFNLLFHGYRGVEVSACNLRACGPEFDYRSRQMNESVVAMCECWMVFPRKKSQTLKGDRHRIDYKSYRVVEL